MFGISTGFMAKAWLHCIFFFILSWLFRGVYVEEVHPYTY
jgi:hypothetical protein